MGFVLYFRGNLVIFAELNKCLQEIDGVLEVIQQLMRFNDVMEMFQAVIYIVVDSLFRTPIPALARRFDSQEYCG